MRKTHYIPVTADVPGAASEGNCALIRRTIRTALAAEGMALPCEIDVLLTQQMQHRVGHQVRQLPPLGVAVLLGLGRHPLHGQHHVPQGPSSSSLTAFRLTTPFLSLYCRSGWISVTMHKVSFGNMQFLFVCTMSPILRSSALIIVGLLSFFSLKVFAVLQCLSLKLNCPHFYKSFYVYYSKSKTQSQDMFLRTSVVYAFRVSTT